MGTEYKSADFVMIPSRFKKLKLPKSDSERNWLLRKYDGQTVLLSDSHNSAKDSYFFAKLNINENNEGYYHVKIVKPKGLSGEKRLHFHDLEGIMVRDSDFSLKHEF